MIVKLIKGHSFKGAAAYLLHDQKAITNERVDWTQTRNLDVQDPEMAWRLMAATAMDADRLKEEAGVSKAGRKAKEDVLHLVLSWHPEERPELDRDQMLSAAESAINALKAKDRQALIIAHNDTEAPHVHVLLNRVSPENGKQLSSSNEKRNLSKWALKYRKDRGQEHYCPERAENDRARKRGDNTKHKDRPRNLIEAEKVARKAANQNTAPIERLSDKLRERTRELGAKRRAIITRHSQEWQAQNKKSAQKRDEVKKASVQAYKKSRAELSARTKALSREMARTEAKEKAQFLKHEKSTLGRIRNAMDLVTHDRAATDGPRLKLLGKNFRNVLSSTGRANLLDARQNRRREGLNARFRTADRKLRSNHAKDRRQKLRDQDRSAEAEKADLRFRQAGEKAALKAQWKSLGKLRERSFEMLASSYERTREARDEFTNVSTLEKIHARAKELRQEAAREQDNEREQDQGRERERENDNDKT